MELFQAIYAQSLINGDIKITFRPDYPALTKIIEGKCYQALQRIREILDDNDLEDAECFRRIEDIVCVFEELGSDGGSRHDF